MQIVREKKHQGINFLLYRADRSWWVGKVVASLEAKMRGQQCADQFWELADHQCSELAPHHLHLHAMAGTSRMRKQRSGMVSTQLLRATRPPSVRSWWWGTRRTGRAWLRGHLQRRWSSGRVATRWDFTCQWLFSSITVPSRYLRWRMGWSSTAEVAAGGSREGQQSRKSPRLASSCQLYAISKLI